MLYFQPSLFARANFLQTVRDQPEKLQKELLMLHDALSDMDVAKAFYRAHRRNLSHMERFDSAAYFFTCQFLAFQGGCNDGGFAPDQFNRDRLGCINRITEIAPLLRGVRITDYDYREVLAALGQGDFAYNDPPYSFAKEHYAFNTFKEGGADDIDDLLCDIEYGNFDAMISYDLVPNMTEFYNLNVEDISVLYRNKFAREVILMNYDPDDD